MYTLTFTQVQWRIHLMIQCPLKTVWAVRVAYNGCLCVLLYLQYHLVWTLCVACDQDLGLLLRFVNEVKVNGKVFTQ